MAQVSLFQVPRLVASLLAGVYGVAQVVALAAFLSILDTAAKGATPISQVPPAIPSVTPTPTPSPSPPIIPFSSPPPGTTPADVQAEFRKYRLGPGDSISVVVPRFPDLNFAAVINPEGNIISPLLGVVPLTGLTLEEAQERIRIALDRFVIDPVVVLSLTAQRPAQITILGEIARPGFYPVQATRIPAALLTAGGTTNRADLRAILVRRTLASGKTLEQTFDLFTPLVNGTPLPDLRLEDGDVVLVPKLEVGTDQGYDRSLVARTTIVKPQITIRILSYPNSAFGNISLPNGSSFVDALATGGIRLDNSNLSRVALIRFDPEQGRAISRELNAKKAFQGDIAQNVPLQDNDVIVIGRNLVGKVTFFINTLTQPFRDVLGFLLFFDQLQESVEDLFGPGGTGSGGGGSGGGN